MNQMKAEEAAFMSNKLYFRAKIITKNTEGHYIIMKGSIHKEDTAILNLCAASSGTALPQGLCMGYSPYPENPLPGNFHTDRSLTSFKSLFQCPNFTVRSH